MNFTTNWRDRRTLFAPTQYSIANYSTESKTELMNSFGDEIFLKNLHLIPDPLKKNLADTLITKEEKMAQNFDLEHDMDEELSKNIDMAPDYSPLGGITSFFSGVFNIISNAMFSKRKQTEMSSESSRGMAVPSVWHGANILDENKTLPNQICLNDTVSEVPEMECRAAATKCQSKLDQIRVLVGSKPVPCSLRLRRRPKKVFVEAGSVEDCFEDAFSPEDFESLPDDSYIEYFSPMCNEEPVFHEIYSPKVQTKTLKPEKACETTEIVNYVPETETNVNNLEKKELVASCEDKITKLKALLQDRRKKTRSYTTETEPEPIPTETVETPNITITAEKQVTKEESPPKPKTKTKDKRYKNRNRSTDKRRKCRMKAKINEDLLFANEIHTEELSSSVDNSPATNTLANYLPKQEKHYFNEVSGCFIPSSVDSEDCFQIVFNDSPKVRRQSDCDSEDSFIIFEDSPDSCYTNNDVFGDSDSDDYDSDSDLSDSGCGTMTFNIASSLSKSVSNLTDDSLYAEQSEDEVDCAQNVVCEPEAELSTGLLIDEKKKKLKKNLPPKKVQFSTDPPKVHVMRVWAFAAKQARCGHWAQYSLDRDRFKRRIADVDMAVSWVLKPQHRSRVMFQRFMPWWNAQRRKEIAEKKEREALEKLQEEKRKEELLREEEERLKEEEEKLKEEEQKLKEEMLKKELEELKLEEKLNREKILKSFETQPRKKRVFIRKLCLKKLPEEKMHPAKFNKKDEVNTENASLNNEIHNKDDLSNEKVNETILQENQVIQNTSNIGDKDLKVNQISNSEDEFKEENNTERRGTDKKAPDVCESSSNVKNINSDPPQVLEA